MGLANPNMCACALCYTRLSRGARTEVRGPRCDSRVGSRCVRAFSRNIRRRHGRRNAQRAGGSRGVCLAVALAGLESRSPRGSRVGGRGDRASRRAQPAAKRACPCGERGAPSAHDGMSHEACVVCCVWKSFTQPTKVYPNIAGPGAWAGLPKYSESKITFVSEFNALEANTRARAAEEPAPSQPHHAPRAAGNRTLLSR